MVVKPIDNGLNNQAFSQTPPPAPPDEVLNRINPFKRNKKAKDTVKKADTSKTNKAAPAGRQLRQIH